MDVLSIVNNVQQVPSEELAASHEKTDTSSRFVLAVACWGDVYVLKNTHNLHCAG